jgi:hypothetical protein
VTPDGGRAEYLTAWGPNAYGVWLQYWSRSGLYTVCRVALVTLTSSRMRHSSGLNPKKNLRNLPSAMRDARIT